MSIHGSPSFLPVLRSPLARGLAGRVALLFLFLCAIGGIPRPAEASTPIEDVAVIYFGSGLIYEVGNGQWVERDLNGKQRGRFVEIDRNAESIRLEDPVTQSGRELNIAYGYIFYVEPDGAKTPVHQIASTKPASAAEYHRVNTVVAEQSRCLEAMRRTYDVPNATGSGTVMMQRYDPEFVDCNESISQRWSIVPTQPVDGQPAYQWRSQRAELAGLDICLTSLGRNGVLAMLRCDGSAQQRWVHPAPNTRPVTQLHSAADGTASCVALKLPRTTTGEVAIQVPWRLRVTDRCEAGEQILIPELRLQRIVD